MIDANAIRSAIERDFNANFDFTAFDNYINNFFVTQRRNNLLIGLEPDVHFKGDGLVSFIPYNLNGYWRTNCQIPYRILQYVKRYLEDNGFKAILKGVAGFDERDVIVVSL